MKGKTILIWCLLGAIILTYVIVNYLVKDYNIGAVQPVDEMSEIDTSLIKGYDVIKDYKANATKIKENKVDFSIVGKDSSPIPFNNEQELQSVIYNMTDYYKIKYTYEGVTYLIYSINDYDLLERTVTAKPSYNKKLLAMYLGVDEKTLKVGQDAVRDLLEGEVYGKDVLSAFESRKAKFEDGTLYFILDEEEIFKYDDLKAKVSDYDIFKKAYETDTESNLVGYTFTKVLE